MVSLYSPPNPTLLKESYNTLRSSVSGGPNSLRVIDVKRIHSVIAMVPHRPFGPNSEQHYFVVEKPGLELAELGGHRDDVPDDDDE
jgi:hypothetical protein